MTVQSDAFLTATGNNLEITGDLRRRSLLCTLDAEMERPELKEFKHDPIKTLKDGRGKYVVAALTLIKAFRLARPSVKSLPPIKNYDQWCNMVRDPLIWLGCADPCETMERIRKNDPALETRKLLAQHWWNTVGDSPQTAKEIIDEAQRMDGDELKHKGLNEALAEVAMDGS